MMQVIGKFLTISRKEKDRGFTLLEYCAGAAVVLAVLYVALNAMGGKMGGLMNRVGTWAEQRTNDINP